MLQVYPVRHDEMQWDTGQCIQSQSDSLLTARGGQQAMQVGEHAHSFGITYIISGDLGRTRHTAEIVVRVCGCDITCDPRLHELNMGVLEKHHTDTPTPEEEGWRRQLVNDMVDGCIPEGKPMQELSDHVNAALASCLKLPPGSHSLLVSHGITLGCLVSAILGLPAWAECRLRLYNCSTS